MEEDNKIDKLFRSTLETHRMEPPPEVWDALDARLNAERDRRRKAGMWRWLMLALLLVSGSIWYLAGPPSPSERKTVSNGREKNFLPMSEKSGSLEARQAATFQQEQAPKESYPVTADNRSTSKVGKLNTAPVSSPQGSLYNPTIQGPGRPVSSVSRTPVNNGAGPSTTPQDPKAPESSSAQTSSTPNTMRSNDAVNPSLPLSENGVVISTASVHAVAAESDVRPTSQETDHAVAETKDAEGVTSVESEETSMPKDSSPASPTLDLNESWIQKLSRHLEADIYFAPEWSDRTLSKNNDYTGVGSGGAIDQYGRQVTSDFSWSSGIRIRYEFSRHFSMGTGLAYSSFSQASVLNDLYVVSDSAFQHDHPGALAGPGAGIHNSHYVMNTACGTISLQNLPPYSSHCENEPRIGDTLSIAATTTEFIQSFHIPLTVRYRLQKGTIAWYAEAGASVNFLYRNRVTVQIDNAYTETNNIVGLKETSYSLLFSSGIQLQVNTGFGLFLEPGIRYYVTPINENGPVKTYPYFLGLKAGFCMDF